MSLFRFIMPKSPNDGQVITACLGLAYFVTDVLYRLVTENSDTVTETAQHIASNNLKPGP